MIQMVLLLAVSRRAAPYRCMFVLHIAAAGMHLLTVF